MTPDIKVKICGLKDAATLHAAIDAGASYLGFNFFPKSPRYIAPADVAGLAAQVPPGVAKVGLLVNPDDETLDAVVTIAPLDFIQLHGAETPDRVTEVKERTGLPVIKVIGIASADDLAKVPAYAAVADQIMVDAKAPKGADLPGGNGVAFDWSLLNGQRWAVPWLLAGGLTPANVGEAITATGAAQVDVASGVESAPGVKDAALMKAFVQAAQGS